MIPILIIAGAAGLMVLIERLWPAHRLAVVPHWWARVLLTHTAQCLVVLLGGITWDLWAQHSAWRGLFATSPLIVQVIVGYLLTTLIYYFWHRVRHESKLFWRLCHQLHHSPRRMEVFMALYKHPVELTLNSLLSALILYPLTGCSPLAASIVLIITGIAEFFYHWNIRTPHWLGYFIQRPESHRIHHQKNHHTQNFADLPIWDMIFGTCHNPKKDVPEVGFDDWREDRFEDMLAFRDVHQKDAQEKPPLTFLPTCLGCSKRWACASAQTQK
jgi:sterol desaturase/sphingolipid hydroxylase (fatty acid hydroxylase superfamily)